MGCLNLSDARLPLQGKTRTIGEPPLVCLRVSTVQSCRARLRVHTYVCTYSMETVQR